VDSVLSADGRRPVRRALVYRTTVIRFFLRSLRLSFATLNLQVSDNLNTLLFNSIVRVTAASRILPPDSKKIPPLSSEVEFLIAVARHAKKHSIQLRPACHL
jgi:hypothetical protein